MGDKKDKQQQIPDHLNATPIEEYGPVKGPIRTKNLSQTELQDKLEVYSRVGILSENYMQNHLAIQKIKQKYTAEIEIKKSNRTKADINYGQGIRSDLPHKSHDILKDDRERGDQRYRDDILSEAKAEYNRTSSLKLSFPKDQLPAQDLKFTFQKASQIKTGRKR